MGLLMEAVMFGEVDFINIFELVDVYFEFSEGCMSGYGVSTL